MRTDRYDTAHFTPAELDELELTRTLRNLSHDVAELKRILDNDHPSHDADARAAMRDAGRDAHDNLTRLLSILANNPAAA